ncbi:nucleoside diphosphate kinase homolog 5 [Nilaparvata lugens]|uniref:nucleoside diphosphate kinase homolog 5 n=1 Tax=Nilaparvata lugens TaxID=108931 RepID=UPI00193CC843|nr:nucleoside diphosphate kinase homolog 5 [Nilaparvata lugens]
MSISSEVESFLENFRGRSDLYLKNGSSSFLLDSNASSIDSGYAYNSSIKSEELNNFEMTLAIIKPEAFDRRLEIEKLISKEHFKIIQKAVVKLTPDQASDFYYDHYGNLNFPKLVLSLSKGPIVVYCLSKDNAISDWKTLLGPSDVRQAKKDNPFSLRALFGNEEKNLDGLHGSDNRDKAENEIHFFFPKILVERLRSEQERLDYLNEQVVPVVLEGLVEVCRLKPADPMLWFADWLLQNNPNKPRMAPVLMRIPHH